MGISISPSVPSLRFHTPGNRVTPLADASVTPDDSSDDIFTNVHEMISGAERSIQIEMYGFGRQAITDQLIAKAKEGVKVQVVLDPPDDEFEKEKELSAQILRESGVEVLYFPVRPADEERKFAQIDHTKMLIVDGDQAIIGGMNWGSRSHLNRDVNVKVEGPAVDRMEKVFLESYQRSGGMSPLPIETTPEHPEGNSFVSLATSSDDPSKRQIKAALHHAIRNAHKSVRVEMFFLTDYTIIEALKAAEARGVEVEVLLNPSQIRGYKANEAPAAELRAAGCEVKWYQPDPERGGRLHAKMGIFDDHQVILGSANWTGNGLTWNKEANVDIVDSEVASYYAKMFEDDFRLGVAEPTYVRGSEG